MSVCQTQFHMRTPIAMGSSCYIPNPTPKVEAHDNVNYSLRRIKWRKRDNG
jgi:hypothetical protein